ncbi:MAG: hypothetical protein JW811_03785 [Clostridiales bacterium]|nr:hypothetical protein [Clostridiales bacterium]
MTFLKYLMLFMIALVIVVVVIVGYFFFTAKVTVADCDITGRTASTQPDLFQQMKEYIALDAFPGTMFTQDEIGDAAGYAFITYTLELSNQCLVPVEMIEIQVIPQDGDVLQIGDYEVHTLEPKTSGSVSVTILTAVNNHSVRELLITYYVWGVSFSITATCG